MEQKSEDRDRRSDWSGLNYLDGDAEAGTKT